MRFRPLLTTLTIVGMLVTVLPRLHAQTPSQNSAAKALFVEGRDLWEDGRFADAEKKFRDALTRYPRAEQSDRTSFYLITTLIKLERIDEARAEIQGFNRNYPRSTWRSDVDEKRMTIGMPGVLFGTYRLHLTIPAVPVPPQPLGFGFMPNAGVEQEVFRVIIQADPNKAILLAKDRLKANPSDPAIVSNFSVIAGSGSPQAFPFFVFVASDGPVPNTQTQARFWIGRLNNAEDAVGKAFVALTADRNLPVVVDVLSQSNPAERSNVLRQVVQYPSLEKVNALEKVYKATTVQPFRSQIVESAGTIPESAAREFLTDVAMYETEYPVRLTAIHALATRKDVDVKLLGDIMKTLPQPRQTAPAVPPRAKKDLDGLRGQTRNANSN
jgi:hypothetical protein